VAVLLLLPFAAIFLDHLLGDLSASGRRTLGSVIIGLCLLPLMLYSPWIQPTGVWPENVPEVLSPSKVPPRLLTAPRIFSRAAVMSSSTVIVNESFPTARPPFGRCSSNRYGSSAILPHPPGKSSRASLFF